ncbi:hypothetical protein Asppvi_000874 [Aspergillus pseudoviridinutans]|uniref:Ornithine carbamoyltransferase, mitochondrial n=1 Tax=Aspergillus pseudoviridinutans TaxID=1517512 RepID=A0A9P3B202_9EURO|nr:uncharacterized protein Asppvi_000874 [Aspergillus pseudoviridinutans]GIJ82367.1 hypothetical protein Asppvi_000874 [Aspergillus pseudoviridinutans]
MACGLKLAAARYGALNGQHLRQRVSLNALRRYSSQTTPPTSPFAPRHFLSIADLTPTEFATLVRNASSYKRSIKSGSLPQNLLGALTGKTVAMIFSKRSTRTRISTEGAVVQMGGHPMFLGKDDIQLGVNESLYDTAVVVSSMVSCIVARVGKHAEVADLAKHSTVPVINALCDSFHPLQAVADFQTMHETFTPKAHHLSSLGLEGLKIAWIGDANNVLFDMAIAAAKMGIDLAVATPKGYEIPAHMLEIIQKAGEGVASPGKLIQTTVPEEAVKDADVLVTDTWVSMGQEAESIKRLRDFEGFQITADLAKRGGAKEGWKFMHCLPRHPEEVHDEVFYSQRSLVFPEAENRLWAAISAIEAFVVNKGKIGSASQSGSGFRSRRSYPSLNHVSLAPLTNRFPIDDETEPQDYFSPRDERPADTPTRTSYLSSFSVPGTPGVLSYSRSGSRVRLHSRSKSSSRIHRSDSSLQSQDDAQPLHHHQPHGSNKKHAPSSRHQPSESAGRRDAEWMLRAGIALASSTREEKGQSWLVKRESSTSLVSEMNHDSPVLARRSRSGRSTPAAHSRWGSRAASRRNSRPDLAMTSLDVLSTKSGSNAHFSAGPDEETRHFVPDFVDERIRAEMASIQQFEVGYASASDEESDSEDEIDEQELQRLTRERGFGLGSWIDRMVEWTLFGVEDLPLSANAQSVQPAKHPDVSPEENNVLDDHSAAELTDDNASVSADESIGSTVVEKPGENGGWEDAGWLLRVMKRALS